jgi:NAD(P)-dependent dehydrogenase (short-subunit alcohol dehydrogenase family)
MSRIFITGSTDGLGQLTASSLIDRGHKVVLHARNVQRAKEAFKKNPGAESVLIGDLSNIDECKNLSNEVNNLGRFDAVIHNAGVYEASSKEILFVNALAPYVLTCLIQSPRRIIYLSSGMHLHGHFNIDHFKLNNRITYSDSKLYTVMLCMAIARKWKDVFSNAVNPGWVPTKMGGRNAPDDLEKGFRTQEWLAVSDDSKAKVSGNYFFHQKIVHHNPEADQEILQEGFLNACKEITGVGFLEI